MTTVNPSLKFELRTAILDAAGRRFKRFGYRKTTMEEIAAEAGLSRGTLYLYYSSKDDLARCWISRYFQKRIIFLSSLAEEATDPMNLISELLVQRVLFAFDAAAEYSDSIDDLFAALRPDILRLRNEIEEKEVGLLSSLLDSALASQAIIQTDTLTAARLLLIATNGLLPTNFAITRTSCRHDLESTARNLAQLLLAGLVNQKDDRGN